MLNQIILFFSISTHFLKRNPIKATSTIKSVTFNREHKFKAEGSASLPSESEIMFDHPITSINKVSK
jgi:hypothetical protein